LKRSKPQKSRPASFHPRASRPAQTLLADIGLPEDRLFAPDPFQSEAVRLVEKNDLLVSAPTGAGKTWIAEQAMRRLLDQGKKTWYASPLKALSNAKLLEFGQAFGRENVGILTGDRKENPGAPIIVGTTEILRNQLYDAMAKGEKLDLDLVVLDEAHYLADPDRGVVWEEVIIYLPVRVRLLLLSATLANAKELAAWLTHIRNQPCQVVRAEGRPVPLAALFLAPDGEVSPLVGNGRLTPRMRHLLARPESLRRPVPVDRILWALEELNLLPAIFFLTSRADCDQALSFCRHAPGNQWAGRQRRLTERLDQLLTEYLFLREHRHISFVRRFGVASHHAGHLPHFRLLVEKLMQKGLLRAIFATSTVAAGVNFPARSVVLLQSDCFNGRHFADLTATELKQMTGRAGRRGMDKAGFIILPPGPHQNLRLLADLLGAPPEPITSQIQLSFSMVLNLLLSHTPSEIKPVLSLSLAAFQSADQTQSERPRYLDRINNILKETPCGQVEQAVVQRRRHSRLEKEQARLETGRDEFMERLRLASLLTPGRIIVDGRQRPWMVRRQADHRGRAGVLATRLFPKPKLHKGKLRLKFLALERIDQVTGTVVELKPDRLLTADLRRLAGQRFQPAPASSPLSPEAQARLEEAEKRWLELKKALAESVCRDCPHYSDCLSPGRSELNRRLNQAESWFTRLAEEEQRLWFAFLSRLDFLKNEGFTDAEGRLTVQGQWAAQLRLDHPLLIAEAIRGQALPDSAPPLLAGLVAPFVFDRDRAWANLPDRPPPNPNLIAAFRGLEAVIQPLASRQRQAGFETPHLLFAPAWAIFNWASGRDWDELIGVFQVAPGDMAALVLRTADNLRQLASLKQTHPRLAATAAVARRLILREPVEVPV